MKGVFALDGPLVTGLGKLVDCLLLSLLWLISSLPIITIGASSTALYAAAYHGIRKDEAPVWRTYWIAFRENWKRSTCIWLILLVLLLVFSVDALYFRSKRLQGAALGSLYYVFLVILCFFGVWMSFLWAYCSRCNGSMREVLKITLQLMLVHPIQVIFVFLPLLIALMAEYLLPGILILLPAPIAYLAWGPIDKILYQHMRPEDRGTEPEFSTSEEN